MPSFWCRVRPAVPSRVMSPVQRIYLLDDFGLTSMLTFHVPFMQTMMHSYACISACLWILPPDCSLIPPVATSCNRAEDARQGDERVDYVSQEPVSHGVATFTRCQWRSRRRRQVLASGTAAAVAGGSLGKGVTVSGAWSRASGTTRSQVFKDDASVKNLKLKGSVFIHDIETLQSSILKINDSVETLKEKCVAFDGASNVGEEILRLCEDGADGIENSSNSLSRICEKLNDFKNAL